MMRFLPSIYYPRTIQKSYQYYMDHADITKIMLDSLAAKANLQRNEI
jgi:hypothetical protein